MIQKYLIQQEMSKKDFDGKRRFSAGAAVPTSKTKKYVFYHKTQLLSIITYPLNPITKPIITIYANVADLLFNWNIFSTFLSLV